MSREWRRKNFWPRVGWKYVCFLLCLTGRWWRWRFRGMGKKCPRRSLWFLWQKMLLRPDVYLPAQSRIEIIDFEYLNNYLVEDAAWKHVLRRSGEKKALAQLELVGRRREMENNENRSERISLRQQITRAEGEDLRLLKSIPCKYIPLEVTQLRLFALDGESIPSEIWVGDLFAGEHMGRLQEEAQQLLQQGRSSGKMLDYLEINHTHPSLEILVEDGWEQSSSVLLRSLSCQDLEVAEKLSELCQIPTKVKAITVGEICYSAWFYPAKVC